MPNGHTWKVLAAPKIHVGGLSHRMNNLMMKIAGAALVAIGMSSVCLAATPEIDPASGANALALLTGALLIIRGRRRK
jgi:hypothetical protein